MNVYLYQPDGEQDNDISFYMPHATNGAVVYLFKMGAPAPPDKTRLVSGYENSRPISMQVSVGAAPRGAYLLSCVRAPCLFRELFVHNKYTAPLGFAVVRAGRVAPEVWHVLGVRRSAEAKRTRRITGLRVHGSAGDQLYPKVLISLAGNVPAGFINELQRCRAHHKDVDVVKFLCGDLRVDNSPVQFEE
ncbi:hypothetical protein [Antheraea proylei nucleopolyhedrovirus]|uniref:Uncharacterized protein n=2 Tax=Antheraea pernyi nuclear polyhedrosis virus TaxID=161494 RepID=A0A2Z6C5V2_NPVAP|nr:hypothetical protein [Antheraea proylei nucleopolyhedrovirus]AYW35357.1 hypothetical protein [Antheraea proylei nucleopolyhedrovirus]BBD50770.1 hypothetical protein [Antheraea proylei nucleopolyhedrovirus]BBD50923.1 hypothetical protein [Antheraea pernyi nucleopolyhedrovirus]